MPELGKTARALAGELARGFRPALDRIRADEGHERPMRELAQCREYVSDATNRRRVVDGLVAAAGAHYEAEWLAPLESADPRGARERGELRAELEAQILAGAEAAGEAQILIHAGIGIEDPLPDGAVELGELLDDGGFVDGITHGRPEREPVRSAVERWREHCETHLGDIASMLLEAMWPEHWDRYCKTRRRGEPERVPTRDRARPGGPRRDPRPPRPRSGEGPATRARTTGRGLDAGEAWLPTRMRLLAVVLRTNLSMALRSALGTMAPSAR